jgi:hypothetical protein
MNTYKPNVTGLAELILKSQGGAVAKTLIHKSFVNYKEIVKEQGAFDVTTSTETKKGKFGQPIFDEFSFIADNVNRLTYEMPSEYGNNTVIIIAPFTFETALIEINQTKNIVKTSIAGRNGTVKEYMSNGDFIINLKGVIVGDVANQRPDRNDLNALIAFLNAPLTLPINCSFCEEFKINSVVIESYRFGQREGARNVIDIEINMVSDTAIVLSTSKSQKDIFTPRAPYVQRASF